MVFQISVYSPDRQRQIVELISSIQRDEFGIDITEAQQPDLKSIPSFYQIGAGNFWVASVEDQVVGTIALKDIGRREAALRKMFVAPAWRGKGRGVAKALLDTLLTWAEEKGLDAVYLGTTAQFLAAHRFYENNGFVEVPKHTLPKAFPLMGVDSRFYRYAVRPRARAKS
jgi:N-acetylglutamate synthase-like GNAT family acetyltransferase